MKKKMGALILVVALVAGFVGICFQGASAAEIKERTLRQTFYREQMILFGLYVYGIEQALAQTVPDLDELHFLAGSIEEIAQQIQTTQEDEPYHGNMQALFDRTRALQRARTPEQGRLRGQALLNSCASCHRTQLPISGRW